MLMSYNLCSGQFFKRLKKGGMSFCGTTVDFFKKAVHIQNKNRIKIEKKFMKEIQRCDYSITLMTLQLTSKAFSCKLPFSNISHSSQGIILSG